MSGDDEQIFGLSLEVDEDSPANFLERIVLRSRQTVQLVPCFNPESFSLGSVFNIQVYRSSVRLYGYTYRVSGSGPERKIKVDTHPVVAIGERVTADRAKGGFYCEPCALTMDYNHGISTIDDTATFLGFGNTPEPPKWVLEEATRIAAVALPSAGGDNPSQSAFH